MECDEQNRVQRQTDIRYKHYTIINVNEEIFTDEAEYNNFHRKNYYRKNNYSAI